MRALLDVNVLIALLDADHSLHPRATEWFTSHARTGWASCPITQNGCVRIMSHPGYPNTLPVRAVVERLAEATTSGLHLYLLALALRRGGRFATFDHSISIGAIKGAKAKDMITL